MGIVLGAMFLVALVLLALYFCIQKKRRKVSGARSSAGSLPVSTNNGRFSLHYLFPSPEILPYL